LGSNSVPLLGPGFVVAAQCSSSEAVVFGGVNLLWLLTLKKVREARFVCSKLSLAVFGCFRVHMHV